LRGNTRFFGQDNFTLEWNSVADRTYQVQYIANLTGTNWTALGSNITATAPTTSTPDSSGKSAQRFYRVLLLPPPG
jgi:hypothetical protein